MSVKLSNVRKVPCHISTLAYSGYEQMSLIFSNFAKNISNHKWMFFFSARQVIFGKTKEKQS